MTGQAKRVEFREARHGDLAAIVALLADDRLAALRGAYAHEPTAALERAFAEIEADPNNRLVVGESDGTVVAVLQLTLIPGLSRGGIRRGQLEAIRVHRELRGRGIGTALVQAAILMARSEGCALVQLTSDKRRSAAHSLYQRLGFVASHEGMKLSLG